VKIAFIMHQFQIYIFQGTKNQEMQPEFCD